jgi:hypothetical protein
MNVFFDVDYTILGMDGSLRPRTMEVFEELIESGHDVYIWSGVGVRRGEIRRLGLEPLVRGVYQKPLSDYEAGLQRFDIPVMPDFVVDDHPGIVRHFGGLCVKPYVSRRQPDDAFDTVCAMVAGHDPLSAGNAVGENGRGDVR